MKTYRISKGAFYGICILILLLPLSRHWRLVAGGEKVQGTVTGYTAHSREAGGGNVVIEYASEIVYTVGDTTYMTYGPKDLEYREGRKVPVLYAPGNPSHALVLKFSAIYLYPYSAVAIILLILWAAFYLSFNSYSKRARGRGDRDDRGGRDGRGGGDRHTDRKSLRSWLLVPMLVLLLVPMLVPMPALPQLSPAPGNPVFSRTIHVEPGMETEVINRLIAGAQPGDTLLFAPGTYRGPFILKEVHGAADLPVVIRGGGRAAIIDGQTAPGTGLDNQAFRLSDCSWIVIEDFVIRNCWTDLVRAGDVSYLSLRNCRMEGGKRALFATGRGSHHFLVEGCTWEQDERVWTHEEGFTWDEVHHGVHSHYNGSLFQGEGISGVFVLRDNLVRNTFNAFRVSMIGDAQADPLAATNGEIYRNTVINTSDNVLEPELHALNLHFYHNRMVNGHAFVSITEVAGGEIYIYGNTALTIPGDEMGWTIFKISSRRTALTRPLYIFNNSWRVNFDMVGSPRNIWENNHVRHFNNACFSAVSDSFGIYNLGEDNLFDYDCSNVPFPSLLTLNGHERHGIVADPGFRNPLDGDFTLVEGSPCIDRGMEEPALLPRFRGDAPDIGAYDDGLPVEGPPFRFVQPDVPVPFEEMPRITRYRPEDGALLLWFSAPLSESSVRETGFRLADRGSGRGSDRGSGRAFELTPELSDDGYCLRLSPAHPADRNTDVFSALLSAPGPDITDQLHPEMPERYLLRIRNKPKGITGMPMTGWASALPVEFRTDR